jgi:hypothetical protein
MQTQQKQALRVIGQPLKTGASRSGFVFLEVRAGEEIYVPACDVTNIRSGAAVTAEAINKYGIRAQYINSSVEINEKTYFLEANLPLLRQAFHLARQGYSLDVRQITRPGEYTRPFPVPYSLGSLVDGKGIFVGVFEINSKIKEVFNIFAAPANLVVDGKSLFTHKEAVAAIKKLTDFYGHAGSDSPHLAVTGKKGDELGQWHLPVEYFFVGDNLHLSAELRKDMSEAEPRFIANYKNYDDKVYHYNARQAEFSRTIHDKEPMNVRLVRLERYDLSLLKR